MAIEIDNVRWGVSTYKVINSSRFIEGEWSSWPGHRKIIVPGEGAYDSCTIQADPIEGDSITLFPRTSRGWRSLFTPKQYGTPFTLSGDQLPHEPVIVKRPFGIFTRTIINFIQPINAS